jgi:outer membrane protein insertion porin family
MELAWVYRNMLGGAEQVRSTFLVGHEQSNALKLDLVKPYALDAYKLHLRFFHNSQNYSKSSGYKDQREGLVLSAGRAHGPHVFSYELCRRSVEPAACARSDAESERSFKSALQHSYVQDTRDDAVLPSVGQLLRTSTELSGWFLGRYFWRHQVDAQLHTPLPLSTTLSLTGSLGLLQALSGHKPFLSDRFFVGGPLSMRGFEPRGLGPTEADSRTVSAALGGDAFFVAGAAVSRSIPLPPGRDWGALRALVSSGAVRVHAFANVANCIRAREGQSVVAEAAQRLFAGVRASVGVGIAFATPLGRAELNLCRPLLHTPALGDRVAYVQAGLGSD